MIHEPRTIVFILNPHLRDKIAPLPRRTLGILLWFTPAFGGFEDSVHHLALPLYMVIILQIVRLYLSVYFSPDNESGLGALAWGHVVL